MRRQRPRRLSPLESVEQQNICNLVRSLGGTPWVLGTRRAQKCRTCGAVLPQGTQQTKGIADLWLYLPAPAHTPGGHAIGLWWEAKRHGETRRPEQVAFGDACAASGTPYGWGTLDDFIGFCVAGGWLLKQNLPRYRQPAAPTPKKELH